MLQAFPFRCTYTRLTLLILILALILIFTHTDTSARLYLYSLDLIRLTHTRLFPLSFLSVCAFSQLSLAFSSPSTGALCVLFVFNLHVPRLLWALASDPKLVPAPDRVRMAMARWNVFTPKFRGLNS